MVFNSGFIFSFQFLTIGGGFIYMTQFSNLSSYQNSVIGSTIQSKIKKADDTAKKFLTEQKPQTDTALIEAQAKKVEATPAPENLAKLQAEATRTTTEFTEAQTRLNELNAPVIAAEIELQAKALQQCLQ